MAVLSYFPISPPSEAREGYASYRDNPSLKSHKLSEVIG